MGRFIVHVRQFAKGPVLGKGPSYSGWHTLQSNEAKEKVSGAIFIEAQLEVTKVGSRSKAAEASSPSASPSVSVPPKPTEDLRGNTSVRIEDHYTFGKEIKTTSSGIWKEATEKSTGVKYAVKEMKKTEVSGMTGTSEGMKEAEILKSISHPNIVNLVSIYDDPAKVYFVYELVTGGELFDKIIEVGSYSEYETCKFSLSHALTRTHSLTLTHSLSHPFSLFLSPYPLFLFTDLLFLSFILYPSSQAKSSRKSYRH